MPPAGSPEFKSPLRLEESRYPRPPPALHKLPKLQPPHPWVPAVCRAVGPQVGTRRPRSSTARGPSSRRTRGAAGCGRAQGRRRVRGVRCARRRPPWCRGPRAARERLPPARLRVSACDRGERGSEPPRAARAAPSPRPAPAPPARSSLRPPPPPASVSASSPSRTLRAFYCSPWFPGHARARAGRAPRVTPAPTRSRVAGTSQQQPARQQPPAPRGVRASCGGPRKLPLGRDSPKSLGAGIIPEKGAGRRPGAPCGTPGVQVPGQVCAWPASLQPRGLRSRTPAHPTTPVGPESPPTRSPKAGLELSRPREEGSEPPQWGLLSRPSHQQHFLKRLIRPSSLRR